MDRGAARAALGRVEGVKTPVPFLRRALASDAFRAGRVHTQMLEQGAFNG
jgi:biotin carboxylase